MTAHAPASPRVGIGLIGMHADCVQAWADAGDRALSDSTVARDVALAARNDRGPSAFVIHADALEDSRTRLWAASQQRIIVVHGPDGVPSFVPDAAVMVELPATIDAIMGALGAPPKNTPASEVVIGVSGTIEREPTAAPDEDNFPWDDEPETDPLPAQPVPAFKDPFADLPAPATVQTGFEDPFADMAIPAPAPVAYVDPFAGPTDETVIPDPLDVDLFGPPPVIPAIPAPTPAYTAPAPAYMPPVATGAPRLPGATAPLSPVAPGTPLAPLLIVAGAKGGVAKTTTSMSLAEHAGGRGNLRRVVLVDMNRGQGGIRINLRLRQTPPSVYDAAITGDPQTAVVGTKRLNEARPDALPDLHFGIALAPPADKADPSVVSDRVYQQVIDYARTIADLVIVDTQIAESHDTSGLFDNIVVPGLQAGAFAVMLSDSSRESVTNATGLLSRWSGAGVPYNRVMIALTRWTPSEDFEQVFRESVARYGTFVGSIPTDPSIKAAMDSGAMPNLLPSMSGVLDEILYAVTGLAVFGPDNRIAAPSGGRLNIFRSLRRKGA